MKINLKSVENFTLNTSIFSILLLTIFMVLAVIDTILGWSLVPSNLELVALSILTITFGIALCNVLLNVLINLSILAKSISKIAQK